MRIVMTVSNPFKPDPRVYKEAKSLAKAGHEVIVIAWDREGKHPKEENVEGFKVIRLGPKASYGPLMALKLPLFYLKTLRLILKLKPDVIHTHDFDTAVLGFIFKKIMSLKWVYDVHDLYDSFVRNKLVGQFIQKVDSLFLKTSDIVISVNPAMSTILMDRGAKNKVIPILNTPDKSPKKYQKNAHFSVFYGGVLSRHRFIEKFVEISETLRLELRIAGGGVLEKWIKNRRHVRFLGYLPHEKALEELGKAHLTFILYDPAILNNRIASPNKLFEAMAVGTPVMVVKDTLLDKLSGKFGILVRYDKKEVKNTLKFLRENPKILKKKSKLGPKIFKKYSWKIQERRLKEIYEVFL